MNTLPTPREAMTEAVNWARQADELMSRLWLDIARELREGAGQPLPLSLEEQPCRRNDVVPVPDVTETAVIRAQQENTEVIRLAPGLEACPACGGNLFTDAGGKRIHRSTYRVECEPAYSVNGVR